MIALISASFSPLRPSTSTTSPVGLFASSGQSVIRTTALSPVVPPRSFREGMNMSVARNLESVRRKATFLSTCSVPMNTWSFFSSISVTTASGSLPRTRAAMVTRTRSPLSACIELRSATRSSSPSASVMTLFLPFARREKTPSAVSVRLGALYLPGAVSIRSPSNASSAR